jgi:hypothetical protein
MDSLNLVPGYTISQFALDAEEKATIKGVYGPAEIGAVDSLLVLAKFHDFEVDHVAPNSPFTLPPSIFGRVTRVRFAGDIPELKLERDQYANPSFKLGNDTAIEVTFYTPNHKGGKTKVVTTRNVIK